MCKLRLLFYYFSYKTNFHKGEEAIKYEGVRWKMMYK